MGENPSRLSSCRVLTQLARETALERPDNAFMDFEFSWEQIV
jgi:hypothetical protein